MARTDWPGLALFLVGAGIAIALPGCAALDAAAVAATHRLDEAPYYVNLSPPPSPGSCAIVLPVTLDPGLRQQAG